MPDTTPIIPNTRPVNAVGPTTQAESIDTCSAIAQKLLGKSYSFSDNQISRALKAPTATPIPIDLTPHSTERFIVEYSVYKETILCLTAYAMASVRLETCSLARMLLTWALTVATLTTKASAIC